MNKATKILIGPLLSVLILGCSGDSAQTQPKPASGSEVPATLESTLIPPASKPTIALPTPRPTQVASTVVPTIALPTPRPTQVAPTSVAATPTVVVAEMGNQFKRYGFSLVVDEDTDLIASGLTVTGLLSDNPDESQGLLSFEYNGADIALSWLPREDLTSADLVDLGYSLLVDSQPENEFIPFADGDIEVGNQPGRFGGLVVSGSDGVGAGGGLIGGWVCGTQDIGFILIATSPDSTVLQIRFDRVISGFKC